MSKISTTVLITALAVALISLSVDPTAIFAQTATTISMVPGSSAPKPDNKYYDPDPANVAVGTTVTWINDDATLHTAVSGTPDTGPSGEFDSSYLAKGKTFEHTFDTAGTFDYYCTLHPFMIGQVVVK
ncbi:MAG: plastocyanin/azurin family copper-binding protein [Thermoproteota archaeon]|nr:plastocyanin/azurin family copper-binding protein [Thermoproteota archaeon]